MRTRLVLALTAVFAIAIASSASALLGTNTNLTTKAAAPSSSSSGGNGSTSGIHDTTKTDRQYCSGDQKKWIEYQGPQDIWPPNHKMRAYKIVAHDDDGGTVTLTSIVTSNQPLNDKGDGNTEVDYDTPMSGGMDTGDGEATHSGWVRGERSGLDKNGRTYTFDETAQFSSDGSSCHKTFTAHVPHDQRNHENSGPKN